MVNLYNCDFELIEANVKDAFAEIENKINLVDNIDIEIETLRKAAQAKTMKHKGFFSLFLQAYKKSLQKEWIQVYPLAYSYEYADYDGGLEVGFREGIRFVQGDVFIDLFLDLDAGETLDTAFETLLKYHSWDPAEQLLAKTCMQICSGGLDYPPLWSLFKAGGTEFLRAHDSDINLSEYTPASYPGYDRVLGKNLLASIRGKDVYEEMILFKAGMWKLVSADWQNDSDGLPIMSFWKIDGNLPDKEESMPDPNFKGNSEGVAE